MSSKIAKEEETESNSDDDANKLTGLMVESSKQKKLKKFDYVNKKAKRKKEEMKDELINLLGVDVVKKYYKTKLQYDKHCDKMLNRRAQSRITNYDVLTRKGLITLKDPLDRLNELARKEKKHADDIHDIFRQDFVTLENFKDFDNVMLYIMQEIFFRLHQGLGIDDHARTFSSLLLAEVDKRNLNPLKQIRTILSS
ncbi:hypothetical protein Tco_0886838 [Tanacetum coccineum]